MRRPLAPRKLPQWIYAGCFNSNPLKIPQGNNIVPIFQMKCQNQDSPTRGLSSFIPPASIRRLPWALPALTHLRANGALQSSRLQWAGS